MRKQLPPKTAKCFTRLNPRLRCNNAPLSRKKTGAPEKISNSRPQICRLAKSVDFIKIFLQTAAVSAQIKSNG